MANILITGTSSGIGLASAVKLAQRGERVFASMRKLERSGPLLNAASAAGVALDLLELDVTEPASIERAIRDVLDCAGSIDVLVNNAAVVSMGPLEYTTDAEVAMVFDTNVYGPLRLIRAVLPHMRERGSGRVVNIASMASHARMGHRLMGIYSASKAALSDLTEELLKEVAPLGIEVVLMDGAIVATGTAMTAEATRRAAALVQEHTPYELVERICQVQWPAKPSLDPAATLQAASRAVADACQVPHPPFIYPPELQGRVEQAASLTDEQFLRLCRIDLAPELYENVPIHWQANRMVEAKLQTS